MALLQLEHVSKSFAGPNGVLRPALRDVSLEIEEGEFVVILGCSGSGKTTLVSLIAGLTQPDSGTVLFDGKPVLRPGPDRGVVFQSHSLLPWLSVYGNVRLAVDAAIAAGARFDPHEQTLACLRTVKLGDALHKRPAELSGGMQQRASVARALAMRPRVLLLDEPFSATDALTRAVLQQELARLWMEERKTIVMVTNDIEEALLLADRILPLKSGAGATVGAEIPVEIARPRFGRRLTGDPDYQRARLAVIGLLARREPTALIA